MEHDDSCHHDVSAAVAVLVLLGPEGERDLPTGGGLLPLRGQVRVPADGRGRRQLAGLHLRQRLTRRRRWGWHLLH